MAIARELTAAGTRTSAFAPAPDCSNSVDDPQELRVARKAGASPIGALALLPASARVSALSPGSGSAAGSSQPEAPGANRLSDLQASERRLGAGAGATELAAKWPPGRCAPEASTGGVGKDDAVVETLIEVAAEIIVTHRLGVRPPWLPASAPPRPLLRGASSRAAGRRRADACGRSRKSLSAKNRTRPLSLSGRRRCAPRSHAQRCSNYSISATLHSMRCRVRRTAVRAANSPYTSAITPLMTSQRPITAAPITAAVRPRRAIHALKRSTLSLVLSGAKT